mmetsp:Transcript_94350/g.281559  ORF Transcript_94350/g.281559 Transcript_94350/m.281559 type:complete len:271 (-) Transcript_94350:159-971(-)
MQDHRADTAVTVLHRVLGPAFLRHWDEAGGREDRAHLAILSSLDGLAAEDVQPDEQPDHVLLHHTEGLAMQVNGRCLLIEGIDLRAEPGVGLVDKLLGRLGRELARLEEVLMHLGFKFLQLGVHQRVQRAGRDAHGGRVKGRDGGSFQHLASLAAQDLVSLDSRRRWNEHRRFASQCGLGPPLRHLERGRVPERSRLAVNSVRVLLGLPSDCRPSGCRGRGREVVRVASERTVVHVDGVTLELHPRVVTIQDGELAIAEVPGEGFVIFAL